MRILIISCIFVCTILSPLWAHGDIHERILKISEEIKNSPDSAMLFFKRGKLYFQHEDYENSLSDLNQSKRLGYSALELSLQFSKTFLKLNDFDNSILYANIILDKQSKHVMAIKLLAQNYFEKKEFEKSALYFEMVIHYSVKTMPENYVDASKAWVGLNTKKGFSRAEHIIKVGIDNLGNLISLFTSLKKLALDQNDFVEAINIQYQIMEIIQRKEFAYFELSKLYKLNNDDTSSLKYLDLSKEHIKKLPQRLQNTSFIRELIESIKSCEAELHTN